MLYLVYVLHWPDDGCFTAETCSPDVIDISSMRCYTYVVFYTVKYIYIFCHFTLKMTKQMRHNIRNVRGDLRYPVLCHRVLFIVLLINSSWVPHFCSQLTTRCLSSRWGTK